MTYCLAMRLDEGLLFLSDTRTNAGVDNVGTYRKLHVFRPAPALHELRAVWERNILHAVAELLHVLMPELAAAEGPAPGA